MASSIPLFINSKDYPTQNSGDLYINLGVQGIKLDRNIDYSVSLVSALVPQSFRNITSDNNKFYISFGDPVVEHTITIEEGQYNYDNLTQIIEFKLEEINAYIVDNDEKIYVFELNLNQAINKAYIKLRTDKFENISLVLNKRTPIQTTFGMLIGFTTTNPIIINTLADKTINLFPHNSVLISSNLIESILVAPDKYLPILHTEHFSSDAAFTNMTVSQNRKFKYQLKFFHQNARNIYRKTSSYISKIIRVQPSRCTL